MPVNRVRAAKVVKEGYDAHPEVNSALYKKYCKVIRETRCDEEALQKLFELDLRADEEDVLAWADRDDREPGLSTEDKARISAAAKAVLFEDRFDRYEHHPKHPANRREPVAETPDNTCSLDADYVNFVTAELVRARKQAAVQRAMDWERKKREEDPEGFAEKKREYQRAYYEKNKEDIRAKKAAEKARITEEEKSLKKLMQLEKKLAKVKASIERYRSS